MNRQNNNNVDLILRVKCDFASNNKSRYFKNFRNFAKYFCYFILRFMNEDFLAIFDLGWPRMTLTSALMKRWCQELHFDIWFSDFASILKFDPKWPQICNLTPNSKFFLERMLRFYWSFWAIFQENWLNLWFLIK